MGNQTQIQANSTYFFAVSITPFLCHSRTKEIRNKKTLQLVLMKVYYHLSKSAYSWCYSSFFFSYTSTLHPVLHESRMEKLPIKVK